MQTENTFTISGNLTRDPETRYTQTGAAVTTITIAATPRQYNKQTGQFENGPALFIRCTAWR
ncbi:single-stranded DNA-binding protein, partial [Aerococcus urinae]|nr:single-stranded DNA-binding protein [Aerococcus urinae]